MYKFLLARRYFVKRKSTALAVAAVALCVFMVVVVMTVMSGLVREFKEKNHRFFGDAIISSDSLVGFAHYENFLEELVEKDYVLQASPVIETVGILESQMSGSQSGMKIMGFDPARHAKVTAFEESLHYREDEPEMAFVPTYRPNQPGVVVGIDLLRSRQGKMGEYYHEPNPMHIKLNVSCFPLTARGNLARAGIGGGLVNTKAFYYSDDSHSGLVEQDGGYIYMSLDDLQALCGMDGTYPRIHSIFVKYAKGMDVETATARVKRLWDDYVANIAADAETSYEKRLAGLMDHVNVETWKQYRAAMIAPMEKEETMMTLVFLMLGFITVFIIFVVFYMMISSKSKDIGILKSMGVSSGGVLSVFLGLAGIVGTTGTAIGMAGGIALLVKVHAIEDWLFENYQWQLWDRSVYAIGEIPNQIEWQTMVFIAACSVAACLAGAAIPSMQAARRRIAEVLQVDQL
ncbi:Lipoprotein-releasing system transmembrane protein LolE [Anaerohalosphaera lusitana]|uniref:Lipoprotein-releasing system transmembrane protein LolE n=1 Tax=Anaerohalosphaera lusitana TaxID=1936003 RepID=A0A1U9NR58_9BACT|nr:FtsX-like permease family protein [Anaerohalosphaera lusitana]AQT70267.1 Lipoprotein-releasing system transmembrane protein LolE [Anaerohalosphaera lusitana]